MTYLLNHPVTSNNLPLDAKALHQLARVSGMTEKMVRAQESKCEDLNDDPGALAKHLAEYRDALSDVMNKAGMAGQKYGLSCEARERAAHFEAGYQASLKAKDGEPVMVLGGKEFNTLDELWKHLDTKGRSDSATREKVGK